MKHLGGRVELDGKELPIADNRAMRPYRMKEVSLVPQYAMSALAAEIRSPHAPTPQLIERERYDLGPPRVPGVRHYLLVRDGVRIRHRLLSRRTIQP